MDIDPKAGSPERGRDPRQYRVRVDEMPPRARSLSPGRPGPVRKERTPSPRFLRFLEKMGYGKNMDFEDHCPDAISHDEMEGVILYGSPEPNEGMVMVEHREDVNMVEDEFSSSDAMQIEMRSDMAPGWVTSVAPPSTPKDPLTYTTTPFTAGPLICQPFSIPQTSPAPFFTPPATSIRKLLSKLRGKHHANRLQDVAESRGQSPSHRLAKGSTISHRWSPRAAGAPQGTDVPKAPAVPGVPQGPVAAIARASDSPTPPTRFRGRHHENRVQDLKEARRLSPPRLRLAQGCWSLSRRWVSKAAETKTVLAQQAVAQETCQLADEKVSEQKQKLSQHEHKVAEDAQNASKQKKVGSQKKPKRKMIKKTCPSIPVLQLAASTAIGGFDFDLVPEPRNPSGVKRERAMSDEGHVEYQERQEEGRGLWKLSYGHDSDTHHTHATISTKPNVLAHESSVTSRTQEPSRSRDENSAAVPEAAPTDNVELVSLTAVSDDGIVVRDSDDEEVGTRPVPVTTVMSVPRGEKRKRREADDGTVEYRDRWATFWGWVAKAIKGNRYSNIEEAHDAAIKAEIWANYRATVALVIQEHASRPAEETSINHTKNEKPRSPEPAIQPKPSPQATETNVPEPLEGESSETALPCRKKVFYYDLLYASQMLSYLLYTSLPTLISDIKHTKDPEASKATVYKTAQQWLDKTGISDISHEYMEEIWSQFVPSDSGEDSDAEYDDKETELGPCEFGQVLDRVFEDRIRPALGPRPDLEGFSQSLTSAEQRALRTRLQSARRAYMDRHEGTAEAEPYGA